MAKGSKDDAAEAPRVGRPRANQSEPAGPVRDEILAAARKLFRTQGFKSTSTRQIASQAGLRQPSLFHYFSNKGEIFKAVAFGAVQPVIDFIEADRARALAPDVALYRLVRFDTFHLCTSEDALGSPFQFPELTRKNQPEFWALRDAIIAAYAEQLEAGAQAGLFSVSEVGVVTQLLFAFGESTLTWFDESSEQSASMVADMAATLALRAVLRDVTRLGTVEEEARTLGWPP